MRTKSLQAQTNSAEATSANLIDFYSMGFKIRTNSVLQVNNNNSDRYIYMAFAEQSGRNEFGTFANAG